MASHYNKFSAPCVFGGHSSLVMMDYEEGVCDKKEQMDEENNFRSLYDTFVNLFVDQKDIPEEAVAEAIQSIIDSFKYKRGGRFSDLDFGRKEVICGYIDRYGPHGAGLARWKIIKALENCHEIQYILDKPLLNVVSLGGGPGNDAIGFCSAMCKSGFTGHLNIEVADAATLFSHCIYVIQKLLKKREFGATSALFQQGKAKLSFSFCKLPRGLYCMNFSDCDVVLICKLLSIMEWDDKYNLIEALHSKMKESAIILLIDSPFYGDLWYNFELLYLSNEDEVYHSGTRSEGRFKHGDYITSRARIAVLKKKSIPPPTTI